MRSFRKVFYLCILFFLITGCPKKTEQESSSRINIWYGDKQHFGILGNPQRQINILGNVDNTEGDIVAFFMLNDDEQRRSLTLGSDLHRLAKPGDFNVEIARSELKPRNNQVNIFIKKNGNFLDSSIVEINYTAGKHWPLPYHIEWSSVKNIQDVAEIVDGKWELTENGIRTTESYYDRIIAFGDSTWKDYEVSTSVIFHDFTPPEPGPPTYNVSHAAIASRWPGHDHDTLQPNRKWHPLGATSEFRITSDYDSCRWRIFDGENFYAEQPDEDYRTIIPGVRYFIKHRVETVSENETRYSVKLWQEGNDEPDVWDFQAMEVSDKQETGSACLIAHHTDVTFGDVEVKPVLKSTEK